jgi:hypothetical protein
VQTDHLGSIRVATTAAKGIQTRYYYDAWGKQTLAAGTSITNRGYIGEEHLMVLNNKTMQKRIIIKLGDIYAVKLNDCQKYFQYVADDMSMLNSRVIRVFKEKYPLESTLDFSKVAQGEIDFYAHTSIKPGVKLGLWEKVGNVSVIGDINVIFRDSKDYEGNNKIAISDRWYVWKINEEFRYVGKLQGDNRNAEIGIVKAPNEIVERMKTGKYSYYYPGFE